MNLKIRWSGSSISAPAKWLDLGESQLIISGAIVAQQRELAGRMEIWVPSRQAWIDIGETTKVQVME